MAEQRETIRDMSDIRRLETIPIEDRLSGIENSYDILSRAATLWPDRSAIRYIADTSLAIVHDQSYSDLAKDVRRAANLFRQLGLTRSDVVSYLLPNLPQTHIALWAGEYAGIVNPINGFLEPAHIKHILDSAKTKLLLLPAPSVDPALHEKGVQVAARCGGGLQILIVGDAQCEVDGAVNFDRLLREQSDIALDDPPGRTDNCAFFHTGGTTGAPKLAMHSHANQIYMAWATALAADFTESDVLLCGLPLFHVNAMMATGLAAFQAGSAVLLYGAQGYRQEGMLTRFWDAVSVHRVTFFSGVPTVYHALLDIPSRDNDLSSLRYAICGAAPMPSELMRKFEAETGVKILEGYGMTEGTCVSTINPRDGDRRTGSVGLRIPYQQMKVASLDDAGAIVEDCAPGEIGSILIKGPNIFQGYLSDDANADIWSAPEWFNSGDLGRFDADGYLWLTGRSKDLIIRGGHNIDPATIEQALRQFPGVQLVAAVGQPDAYAGETPVAYVVLEPGMRVSEEELLKYAAQHIHERAAVPVRLRCIDEMPLTAVGKIFKPQLSWWAAEDVFKSALCEEFGKDFDVGVVVSPDKDRGAIADLSISSSAGEHVQAQRVERVMEAYAMPWRLVNASKTKPEETRCA